MSKSVDRPLPLMEVERLHRPEAVSGVTVKDLHRLPDKTLQQAKVRIGQAVKAARGPMPLRVLGAEGLISGVESGDKVPDYMARIYNDDDARRRFAREWLRGDAKVRRRVSLEWDEEVG